MKIVLLAGLILIFAVGPVCLAQESSARDNYYDGLSKVIEANIDNPKKCLESVEAFINRNKKLIENMLKEPVSLELKSPKEVKITPQARFNRAMANFSAKYPQEGEKIMILNVRALIPPIENTAKNK